MDLKKIIRPSKTRRSRGLEKRNKVKRRSGGDSDNFAFIADLSELVTLPF